MTHEISTQLLPTLPRHVLKHLSIHIVIVTKASFYELGTDGSFMFFPRHCGCKIPAGAYQMHAELPWVRPSDRQAQISPDGLSIDILGLRQARWWTFLEGFGKSLYKLATLAIDRHNNRIH